ncbi:hypothetical protein [Neotamlana nanhaiensis]|nr:hypothetical protein [Tamlana nanhaiensis]
MFRIVFIVLSITNLFGQNISFPQNGIDNPNILTTHHFGIFSSRIASNLKHQALKNTTLTLNISSGNNFHPYVEGYFPKNPEIRQQFSETTWYNRRFNYVDEDTTPADYMNIVIDAVIKNFSLGVNIPINKNRELNINLRSYLITKGAYPFSPITSDETIEWFHSQVIAKDDPFGRKHYGLNQVNFKYLDRNGKTLQLNTNDFFIGGLAFNHFYYPELAINKSKQLFINLGTHLGINTSKFNASTDVGASVNAIKKFNLKNKYELNFGIHGSVLRKNIINFNSKNSDLGNNKYLATFEANPQITKYTKKGNFNAIGINYQIQTSYNKKEEADYYFLLGDWQAADSGWHHGISELYNSLSNWSLIYSYGTPKFQCSFYIKQDFLVNNAPDLQTGISFKKPLFY